jgi:hypothetical protein
VAEQIQFSSDGSIHSMDGQVLNRGVMNPSAMSDSQKAGIGIQTRNTGLSTFNSATGPATQRPGYESVQMLARTGLVTVAGHQVTEEVAATLAETAPDLVTRVRGVDGRDEYLTVAPSTRAAEANKAEADAAKEEADRVALNRHSDDSSEAAHMMFVGEVPNTEAIALLVQMHRDGAPSESTLHSVSERMGLTRDQGAASLNKMAAGVQNQLSALATAHGVNADEFADWMRSSRREESLKALTTHVMSRDVFGAWNNHLTDFVARGNKR